MIDAFRAFDKVWKLFKRFKDNSGYITVDEITEIIGGDDCSKYDKSVWE